ncbi:unnamed protein product [Dibothriocephalus latus]|uniref:EF-hand domain-containing protein n=1 Tax=Dibothriocephalus latus TaxID=60516 RepID=A0A3P6PKR8_DIBLA|nr:unnamed protein product [Dibothriocephalus latus]
MSKLDINGDGIITLGEYKVALNISSQPMDAWKEMFQSLDKDGSGTISVNELKAFLASAGSADMQDTVDAWMEDYDTNNDGQLNYQEFLGFIATLEEWRELFDLIDVDRSGEIDAAELMLFLKDHGYSELVPAVKAWIKEFDRNGDGKLQYREFLSFVASREC